MTYQVRYIVLVFVVAIFGQVLGQSGIYTNDARETVSCDDPSYVNANLSEPECVGYWLKGESNLPDGVTYDDINWEALPTNTGEQQFYDSNDGPSTPNYSPCRTDHPGAQSYVLRSAQCVEYYESTDYPSGLSSDDVDPALLEKIGTREQEQEDRTKAEETGEWEEYCAQYGSDSDGCSAADFERRARDAAYREARDAGEIEAFCAQYPDSTSYVDCEYVLESAEDEVTTEVPEEPADTNPEEVDQDDPCADGDDLFTDCGEDTAEEETAPENNEAEESTGDPCVTPNGDGCVNYNDVVITDCYGTPEQCGEPGGIIIDNGEADAEDEAGDGTTSTGDDTFDNIGGIINVGQDVLGAGADIFGDDALGGVFSDGEDFLGDIEGVYEDIAPIFKISKELLGLVQDFSVSGLGKFACSNGSYVDEDVAQEACKVSETVNKLEQTFTDSRGSFLATADDVFMDLATAGWFDGEGFDPNSPEVAQMRGAIEEFDTARRTVGDGASLKDLYDKGKAAIEASKQVALSDKSGDEQGGAAFTAAKNYRIEKGALLQENSFKSKVTQKAAQDLSDTSLKFTGEAENLNQEFAKLSGQRQAEGMVAVSTRAATQVAIDEQADSLRQFSMYQIQTSKQLATLTETQVMTVSQLSLQNEELFRQAQQEIDQAQARDKEQLRREQEMVDETTQLATDVAAIFGSNLPTDE